MAVSSGWGPHAAWIIVGGASFPIESGTVTNSAQRRSSSYSVIVPMAWPGARAFFAGVAAGTDVKIMVMTRGQWGTLFTGEIDEPHFDYIPGRTIRVSGRDKSYKLHEGISSEKWLNKMPSEIVQDLIGRVGLSGDVASSAVKAGKKLQQDYVKLSENSAFSRIISEMADIDGCRWWVDQNGQFHYQPIGQRSGIYSITIQQDQEPIVADCLALQVAHNLQAGRPQQVTVKGWHPKKQQVIQAESNVPGKGPMRTWNYQVPTVTQERADRHAKSEANEKARHEFNIHAVVVGDPAVQAGMGLQLSGTDFDGTYDIDVVVHNFGMSGHRTNITAVSPASGRSAS